MGIYSYSFQKSLAEKFVKSKVVAMQEMGCNDVNTNFDKDKL